MARDVRPFLPTWKDKRFAKALKALRPSEKDALADELAELIDRIAVCRHPIREPELKKFRPTPYRLNVGDDFLLAEYRLKSVKLGRVVAAFDRTDSVVLLLAITLTHDHERIERMLKQHRRHLTDEDV